MDCGCGNNNQPKADNAFPKAVVEIINPETLTLFRRVEVDGTAVENPPVIGAYHNVLLVYKGSGQAVLYSSDGIPTELTQDTAELEKAIEKLEETKADRNELARVAFSGKYEDLLDTPIIGDGTITIISKGVKVGEFSTNQTENAEIDLNIPTKTSDLENDGDGTSAFATEQFVNENGGKIDVIKVNGVAQEIVDKAVDIAVPTDYATRGELEAEATTRKSADDNIQENLNAFELSVETNYATKEALNNETTARTEADTALDARVDTLENSMAAETERTKNLPPQVVFDKSLTEYTATTASPVMKVKDLHTNGDATIPMTIEGATETKAGVMTAEQVTTLNNAANQQAVIQSDLEGALGDIAAIQADYVSKGRDIMTPQEFEQKWEGA